MVEKSFFAAVAVFAAWAACGSETILDVDFSLASNRVDSVRVGTCQGVLPAGMGDNFSTWSKGRCTISPAEEEGVKYLRFVSDASAGTVQFVMTCRGLTLPGFFRLRVEGRTRGGALRMGLRRHGAPYTQYSSHSMESDDWDTKEFLVCVRQKTDAGVGMYLYLGSGEVHLRRMVLEKVDREAIVRSIKRPPPERRTLVGRRFLLGLPNGWNDDRNTETGTATAVEDPETKRPVLRLASGGDKRIMVWGEPFQTSDPYGRHTVSFRCRGAGEWSAQTVTDGRRTLGSVKCALGGGGWRTVTFGFKPDDLAKAFAVKFEGKGELFLDDLRVGIGEAPPERGFGCDCALAPAEGEIAGISRIWFAGEKMRVRWATEGAPAGAVLRLSFTDLYGRTSRLRDIPLKGGGLEKGTFDVSAAVAGRTGQFRVTAEVFKENEVVSAPDEFVFTRIARPIGWGRDMPDSPFGVHMEPRPGTIAAMKACGINWTRLHDAATRCTGWSWLEPEKGKWTFYDDSVARFRKGHVKIFAQLGTAPTWATHYGDLGLKYVGYFEKYLRPVDMAAWTNYVTTVVKRYRGTIDEYFVWNEPWGRWWKSAADLKFYDKNRTAQDFGVFQTVTYRAVKAVDPRIKVSGFNTFSDGEEWTAGVAEGGGWDSCDIVDYHVYTPALRAHRNDRDYTLSAFRPLLKDHPHFDGRPVYMSEGQGTSTGSDGGGRQMSGLYARLVPWEPESPAAMARCADATCRYTLSLLAAGDARVFLYTAHGYSGLVSPPSFTVLVGADGYPYPSLAAYAFFTRALEGRVFAGREDFGAKGCVYEFRGAGGRRGTVRLYTDLAVAEADSLAASVPLRDLYGNPYSRDTWFKGSLLYSFVR